jgi:hypothetical protein
MSVVRRRSEAAKYGLARQDNYCKSWTSTMGLSYGVERLLAVLDGLIMAHVPRMH